MFICKTDRKMCRRHAIHFLPSFKSFIIQSRIYKQTQSCALDQSKQPSSYRFYTFQRHGTHLPHRCIQGHRQAMLGGSVHSQHRCKLAVPFTRSSREDTISVKTSNVEHRFRLEVASSQQTRMTSNGALHADATLIFNIHT